MNHEINNLEAWEQELDRKLNSIPAPHAPQTLAPRVLHHIRQREAQRSLQWWKRPVQTWPSTWQTSLVVGAVILIGLLIRLVHVFAPTRALPSTHVIEGLSQAFEALQLAVSLLLETYFPFHLQVLGLLYLAFLVTVIGFARWCWIQFVHLTPIRLNSAQP